MTHDTDAPCTEPEGNAWFLNHGITQHDACLEQLGHCPWCGEEDNKG